MGLVFLLQRKVEPGGRRKVLLHRHKPARLACRILRLNADLDRLKKEEPLPAKRAWFNDFLEEKLARSRMRYYQEPVILLDE